MKGLIVVTCVLVSSATHGQNLDNFGKGKLLHLSGGINTTSVFYAENGISDRRDPINYFTSGNLNISIYDWSVPLSFSYSNQNRSFHQPFNRYGLSPSYKWLTLHAGYRSMSFSNYSVNGHLFLGGGADVKCSDVIKVSIFYGRLQKAASEDTTKTNSAPSYRRMGGGAKISIGKSSRSFDLLLFKAKDDIHSIAPFIRADISPQENVVLGLNGALELFDHVSLKVEYASSALSGDVRSEQTGVGNLWSRAGNLFTTRTSSSFYNAVKGSALYSLNSMAVGITYEKVDPGYRTLGAYYFNNNIETLAFTTSTSLIRKQLRVNAQLGTQRNNLDRTELNTMRRLSSSVSANYQPSKRATCQFSYSNFQTVVNFRSQFDYINQTSPYENLDTLRYRQLSRNAALSANFVTSESKEKKQTISVNLSCQQSSNVQNTSSLTGSLFYNLNGNYSTVIAPLSLNVVFSANANFTKVATGMNKIFGPSVSGRKSFLAKKLNGNTTVSYNESYLGQSRVGRVFNVRVSLNYIVKEKHAFDFGLTRISRSVVKSEQLDSFAEVTAQLSYAYSFATK